MRDHIQQGWCRQFAAPTAALPPPDHNASTEILQRPVSCDEALCHNPTIQRMIRVGLHAFLQDAVTLQKLKRHCVLCNQWLAGERHMKTHYKHMHAEFLQEHQQSISSWVKRTGQAFNPCLYCAIDVLQTRGHIPRCTVLFQLGALFVPARQVRHGGRDLGSLRQGILDTSIRNRGAGQL